jgi:hypothetical protein
VGFHEWESTFFREESPAVLVQQDGKEASRRLELTNEAADRPQLTMLAIGVAGLAHAATVKDQSVMQVSPLTRRKRPFEVFFDRIWIFA